MISQTMTYHSSHLIAGMVATLGFDSLTANRAKLKLSSRLQILFASLLSFYMLLYLLTRCGTHGCYNNGSIPLVPIGLP